MNTAHTRTNASVCGNSAGKAPLPQHSHRSRWLIAPHVTSYDLRASTRRFTKAPGFGAINQMWEGKKGTSKQRTWLWVLVTHRQASRIRTRWQSRSQELPPPRRFSYEHTRCVSSGVEFMDLIRTIGFRRSESCRLATPKSRAKAGDRRVQCGRDHPNSVREFECAVLFHENRYWLTGKKRGSTVSLTINVREATNATILEIAGRLTLGTSGPSLRDTVGGLVDSLRKNIVLDLSAVTY
jgi:hypothetical protein